MSDLADWLLAQLAADEAACGGGDEPKNWCDRATGVHYDPARVLADVKAKRAVVEIHRWAEADLNAKADMQTQDEWAASLDTLRALAQPYRGAEGWQEAWNE